MKKIVYIIAALLPVFSPFISNAQAWTQVGYMIESGTDTVNSGGMIRGYGSDVYCPTSKGLFRSSDNGDSWTNISYAASATMGEELNLVFVSSAGDIYTGSDEKLYRSTDNGGSWTAFSGLPDSLNFRDVAEINGHLVASYKVAFATGGAYYSTDNGSTWTLASGLPDLVMGRLLVWGDSLFLGGKNGVYLSTDDGESWTGPAASTSTIGGIWDVVRSGETLFAGDVGGGGLFVSYDHGANWANADTSNFNPFCQVFSLTESAGMILTALSGGGNCNNIKMSDDDGLSWNPFMSGITPGYYSIVGRNEAGTSFFTKKNSEVYRYDLVTGTSSPVTENIEVRVYPQPATETVNFDITGIPVIEKLSIRLLDLMGREVLFSPLQNPSRSLDISGISPGMYVFRIEGSALEDKTGRILIH